MVLPTWPLPGGEATAPLRGGLRCGLARTRPDRCSYNGFRRSINKPITAPWPLFSPASCRAVGRGGGGHGKSPGRTVGTPAQYSSGLQEPSRSWISNADIPDRGRRQQGFLRGLAGYGPSVFLPDGRGFAVHAVLSSRTDRQGGDSCGMVFLRERRDALQPRAGQAEHVDGCESSSKPVLQNLFKHGPK